METKPQINFDINLQKFEYLKRKEKKRKGVDINELNNRLDKTKRSDFYTNVKIIALCLSFIAIIFFISWKT